MAVTPFICMRCVQALRHQPLVPPPRALSTNSRLFSHDNTARPATEPAHNSTEPTSPSKDASSTARHNPAEPQSPSEPGVMSRRLEEATEAALLTGGRAGARAVEDAGFSEELKARLLSRLSDARADNASAISAAGFPAAGAQSSGIPGLSTPGQPWTGEEPTADAVLRMLEDAHRPLRPDLRGKSRIPTPRSGPVDMRIRRAPKVSPGTKAATARDMAAAYAGMGLKEDKGISEEEREAFRKEFKERFSPGARSMPNSITGLAALANERIEDAIARGQFKDIPRGKGIERDARADNPFIDTTEYIMNNMIKRQEIVPPWIEKQQEVTKAAGDFRKRLRKDWMRHATRMITSGGGSLEEKMNRAAAFARAEEEYNPRRRNVDQIPVPTNTTGDTVMTKIRQQATKAKENTTNNAPTTASADEPRETITGPFRDPTWEAAERSYLELSVANLNALTRSYNLMAPELAKKSYFSLDRELSNCFADVAPLLADEIKERAAKPSKPLVGSSGAGTFGILGRFGGDGGGTARIYDSTAPKYGFKEMWRDLWKQPS